MSERFACSFKRGPIWASPSIESSAMFTDPQEVTVSAVARSLPRTSTGDNSGAFKQSTGATGLAISHQYGKRSRHTVSLTDTKTTADPLVSGSSFYASMTVRLIVDMPTVGYTVAEAKAIVDGLTKFLTDGAGAAATKIIGGES